MGKFICYWGIGYTEEVSLKTSEWFTGNRGYNRKEIRNIMKLKNGERYQIQQPEEHWIMRIR